jgi:hypothetical protein
MRYYLTESEFWRETAAHIKYGGIVPASGFFGDNDPAGLCFATFAARKAGVISRRQEVQCDANLRKQFYPGYGSYYWPLDDLQSRYRACLKLARLAEARERKAAR